MLWLLPYFGYAIAASAVASAVGYAAVTRFSVVQRVLAVALDRALNAITKGLDGKTTPYTVEHTETGKAAIHSGGQGVTTARTGYHVSSPLFLPQFPLPFAFASEYAQG